jgi:hypothetical protein
MRRLAQRRLMIVVNISRCMQRLARCMVVPFKECVEGGRIIIILTYEMYEIVEGRKSSSIRIIQARMAYGG